MSKLEGLVEEHPIMGVRGGLADIVEAGDQTHVDRSKIWRGWYNFKTNEGGERTLMFMERGPNGFIDRINEEVVAMNAVYILARAQP